MATEPLLVAYGLPVVQPRHFVRSNVPSNYWTLTKPEINFLIGLATGPLFSSAVLNHSRAFHGCSLYTRFSGRSWLRAAQVH
jgi:hypothetical protein